jgi:hypothetical protein
MDSTADTLRNEIDQRRQAISNDVDQLEERVHELTDVQHQFSERPMAFLGLAFGGGVLLGMLMGGSNDNDKRDRRRDSERRYTYSSFATEPQARYRGNGDSGDDSGFVSSLMSGSPGSSTESGKRRASSTFDEVRGALMAYAATRAEDFLKEALPGFNNEVEKVRRDSGRQDQYQGQPGFQSDQQRSGVQSSINPGSTTVSRGEV